MEQSPMADRRGLLRDRAPGYLAGALEDYIQPFRIRHIYCSPYHPQTNGKLERFHETLAVRLNPLVFTSPETLRAATAEFIAFYKYRRYHIMIGNVTTADIYYSRLEQILRRRKELKEATMGRRFQFNLGQRPNQTRSKLGSEV